MFQKIAFAQELLRTMAGEKRAGVVAPLVAGAALAGGAATVAKGLKKGREYRAGFAHGVIESRMD